MPSAKLPSSSNDGNTPGKKGFIYEYPRPGVAVDAVVFGLDEQALKVLLIRRGLPPFMGCWALPGGYVRMDESLDEAVRRELSEETGLDGVFLEQLYTYGAPHRDPRDRIISVAYFGLVNIRDHRIRAATDASSAEWHPASDAPPLAFDHDEILSCALARLQGKVRYQPIGFELLPPKFTLSQLQYLYEIILGHPLDKRNFRRKILEMDLLVPLAEKEKRVSHRAAQFFRFNRQGYLRLAEKGFNFEI